MFVSVCGKTPRDEGAAFVAENAVVAGEVTLAPGSTVWYGAVVRGDEGPIFIGENANVQDNAVLHCDAGGCIRLGRNVTVGHGAIVHGAEVGEGSLIGMHATLLNGCNQRLPGRPALHRRGGGAGARGQGDPGRHGGRRGARPGGERRERRAGRRQRIQCHFLS